MLSACSPVTVRPKEKTDKMRFIKNMNDIKGRRKLFVGTDTVSAAGIYDNNGGLTRKKHAGLMTKTSKTVEVLRSVKNVVNEKAIIILLTFIGRR